MKAAANCLVKGICHKHDPLLSDDWRFIHKECGQIAYILRNGIAGILICFTLEEFLIEAYKSRMPQWVQSADFHFMIAVKTYSFHDMGVLFNRFVFFQPLYDVPASILLCSAAIHCRVIIKLFAQLFVQTARPHAPLPVSAGSAGHVHACVRAKLQYVLHLHNKQTG